MSTNNSRPVGTYGYPSQFMTRFELADLLHLKTQTLHNHRHEIPGRRKIGNEIFYDRTVINQWLAWWVDQCGGDQSIWKFGKDLFELAEFQKRG